MKKYLKSRRRYKKRCWIRFFAFQTSKGGYFDVTKKWFYIPPGEFKEGIYLKPGVDITATHSL